MDGGTLVIGAPYFAAGRQPPGAASIYIRSGSTWVLQQRLVGARRPWFRRHRRRQRRHGHRGGSRLRIRREPRAVYVRNGSAWTLQATLIPNDIAPGPRWTAQSVAIDGNTAVVGIGSGAVVCVRPNRHDLDTAGQTDPGNRRLVIPTRRSIALDGDTALIGAPYATVGANAGQGAALVFVRSGSTWSQQGALTSAAGRAGSRFGATVALSGDTALFLDGGSSVTRAYRFTRTGGVWTEQTPIVPPNTSIFTPTVNSVALDTDTAILGVRGSAHVFRRIGGQWTFQDRLVSGYVNVPQNENFGLAAARLRQHGGRRRAGLRTERMKRTAPAAPTCIRFRPVRLKRPTLAGSASGTTVSLSWTPAAGAAPTSYIVEAGTTPGASNVYVGNVGNVLALSTAAPAATYHVRVRGVNAFGPGAASNEVTLTVGTPTAPLPGAPTLTGSVAQTSVSLAWTPAATGGAPTSCVTRSRDVARGLESVQRQRRRRHRIERHRHARRLLHPRPRRQRLGNRSCLERNRADGRLRCSGDTHRPELLCGGQYGDPVVEPDPWRGRVRPGSGDIARRDEYLQWPGGRGDNTRTQAPSGTYYVRILSANNCGVSNPAPEVAIVVPVRASSSALRALVISRSVQAGCEGTGGKNIEGARILAEALLP